MANANSINSTSKVNSIDRGHKMYVSLSPANHQQSQRAWQMLCSYPNRQHPSNSSRYCISTSAQFTRRCIKASLDTHQPCSGKPACISGCEVPSILDSLWTPPSQPATSLPALATTTNSSSSTEITAAPHSCSTEAMMTGSTAAAYEYGLVICHCISFCAWFS